MPLYSVHKYIFKYKINLNVKYERNIFFLFSFAGFLYITKIIREKVMASKNINSIKHQRINSSLFDIKKKHLWWLISKYFFGLCDIKHSNTYLRGTYIKVHLCIAILNRNCINEVARNVWEKFILYMIYVYFVVLSLTDLLINANHTAIKFEGSRRWT